jgi:hypothetical protein
VVDIPKSLLRFFDREQYALNFLDGEIRFGLLEYYRKIEGSRGDDKEGLVDLYWNCRAPQLIIDKKSRQVVARTQSDQNIHYSGSSLNRYYILSTSHCEASVGHLVKKFGRFVVRINDPLALLERIKAAWQNHPLALEGSACIAPVVYNKSGLLEPDPNLIAPVHYSYSQKATSHEEGKEFRYVLECRVDAKREWEDFLTLRLCDCRDICTLSW